MATTTASDSDSDSVRRVAADHDKLNIGCGNDQPADYLNVDVVDDVDPDLVLDVDTQQWPFPSETFDEIRAWHVLEHLTHMEAVLAECARCLRPDGRLAVRIPIGRDMVADPDHIQDNEWDWVTPEMFCGKRHWDTNLPLTVEFKDVDIWTQIPGIFGWWQNRKLNYLIRNYGPGRWCFNLEGVSGEFTVHFRKTGETEGNGGSSQ